jgi:AraC-like DNA-binding protein
MPVDFLLTLYVPAKIPHHMLQESITLQHRAADIYPNVLLLNGHPAITRFTFYSKKQGSLFLEENSLLVVKEGALNLKFGDLDYMINKRQLIVLAQNTLVEWQSFPEPGTTVCFQFSFNQHLLKQFTTLAEWQITGNNETPGTALRNQSNHLQKYLDSLDPYLDNSTTVNGCLTKIKLLELLFCLASTDSSVLSLLLQTQKTDLPNIKAIVEEHVMSALPLSKLAALSQRSLSSFRRDFLSIYNMPPSKWIRERRLKKAQDLLCTTRMSITDICYSLGFENITHFSRLFKSRFGFPPSTSRTK